MANVKVTLDIGAITELRKSAELQKICRELGEDIARRAGDGYEVYSYMGTDRCKTAVSTGSIRAIRDNAKNNTLLKAMR